MAENDEATNAMIASLIAQDQGGYQDEIFEEMGQDDSEDEDYGGAKKRKRQPRKGAGAGGGRGGRRKSAPAADGAAPSKPAAGAAAKEAQESSEHEGDAYTASGRRKRKDAGQQGAREKSRGWSDDEEKMFMEALDVHGRDWKAAAAYVGTRDARAFTSHAQKHFIKLCLAGKPLPPKVAETGLGYTLSGKPLDPNSAAAKAYGFKPDSLAKLQGSTAQAGIAVAGENTPANGAAPGPTGEQPPKRVRGPRKPKAEAAAAGMTIHQPPGPVVDPMSREQTDYAKNRPRRELPGPRNTLGVTTESLELCRLHEFVGAPGSGAPLAQPFSVQVAAEVMLLMDLHAHMSSYEVIGLLGGTWDMERLAIRIVAAFPCRRAQGSHSSTGVELDPEDEVATRALMDRDGLKPIGWYHSHPVFEPRPSQKDNENQRNYQALFCCSQTRLEPFLGFIVGPYDLTLPSPASVFTCFTVKAKAGELSPFAVRNTIIPMAALPSADLTSQLLNLIHLHREDVGQVDLSEQWRPFESLAGGQPSGPALTKLAKLRISIAGHLPDNPQVDAIEKTAWLDKLTLASSPDKVLREAQPTSAAKTAAVASLPMSAATGVTA
ncbi:hypothetical protein WJX84_008166 [Apatococcus fuscideae]|uniref:Myb-like, SWIRM and MPN domain-containing protein 1 n=1 Tax=Apatococcus fuscideae TaxID=2026836 RepID=A0AAW1TGX0_9CHLO